MRRTKIAEVIGGLDLAATVVIGTPLMKSKPEWLALIGQVRQIEVSTR